MFRIHGRLKTIIQGLNPGMSRDSFLHIADKCGEISRNWISFARAVEMEEDRKTLIRLEDPELHFQIETLVPRTIRSGFFDHLPEMLTGLGILGTFIGLAGGIYLAQSKIVMTEISQVRLGLQSLLSGASLAFLTSIAGISMSLVFTFVRILGYRMITLDITRMNSRIKQITIRRTPEQYMMHRLEKSIVKSGEIASRIISERLIDTLKHLNESMLGEQAVQNAKLDEINQNLVKYMGSVARGLDNMSGIMVSIRDQSADSNKEILQAMVSEFQESMTRSSGRELQELTHLLGALNTSLENARAGLDSGRQLTGEMMENLGRSMEQTLNTFRKGFTDNITQTMESILDGIRASGTAVTRQMETTGKNSMLSWNRAITSFETNLDRFEEIMRSSDDLMKSTKDIISLVDSTAERINLIHQNFKTIARPVEELVDSLSQSNLLANETSSQYRKLANTMMTTLQTSSKLQDKLGMLWDQYPGRFATVDQNLREVFQAMDSGISQLLKSIGDYVSGMDKHFDASLHALSAAVSELNTCIAQFRLEKPGEAAVTLGTDESK